MERDTLPPTPASTDQLLQELLAVSQGTRDDMSRIGTALAKKIDDSNERLESKIDSLAGTVQDLSLVVVELDTRVGHVADELKLAKDEIKAVKEQVKSYANEQIALAARVTALETARSSLTPMVEEALREIVPAVQSIARSLDPGRDHER